MAPKDFNFDQWWNERYFFHKGFTDLRTLYKTLNALEDIEFVELLLYFVFPSSPGWSSTKSRYRIPSPQQKLTDLSKAQSSLKRLRRYSQYERPDWSSVLERFIRVLDTQAQREKEISGYNFGQIFNDICEPKPLSNGDYPTSIPLVFVGGERMLKYKKRLKPYERAIVDVAESLGSTNSGQRGRPKKQQRLFALAIAHLLRKRTKIPHFRLVAKCTEQHFSEKISYGYIRNICGSPSSSDKKFLNSLDIIFKSRQLLQTKLKSLLQA